MSEWLESETAPNGQTVMTKIDDGNGLRNEQALRRSGNLWFVPDGSMYVYYQPTHWRPLTAAEREAESEKIARKQEAADATFKRARLSL